MFSAGSRATMSARGARLTRGSLGVGDVDGEDGLAVTAYGKPMVLAAEQAERIHEKKLASDTNGLDLRRLKICQFGAVFVVKLDVAG